MKKSLFMLLLLLFAVQMHAQQVYYVKPVATGLGDGSSWDNAGDLRTALDSVSANTQIWAMAGTYLDSFTIKCPVEIYGSFSGEEDSPDDRGFNHPVLHPNHLICHFLLLQAEGSRALRQRL